MSIDTGCQCLRLKTKSGEVLPGETLVGMLTLSTRKPGHNGANLTLRTNDPYNQVVVIRCTWDVEAKYQFEDSDVLLGDVRRNEVFEFSTHVVYADSGNYGDVGDAKLSIEVENGHKYAECELFKDGERVSGVRVSGVVPSVATPGAEEVVVILKDKEVVYSKLRVRWNVVQPLSVRPEKLSISGGDIDSVQVVWLETESTPKRRIGESGESLIDVNCPEGVTVDHLGRDDQWHKFGISVSPEALLLLKTGDQTVMFSSGKETVGLCLSLDTRGAR